MSSRLSLSSSSSVMPSIEGTSPADQPNNTVSPGVKIGSPSAVLDDFDPSEFVNDKFPEEAAQPEAIQEEPIEQWAMEQQPVNQLLAEQGEVPQQGQSPQLGQLAPQEQLPHQGFDLQRRDLNLHQQDLELQQEGLNLQQQVLDLQQQGLDLHQQRIGLSPEGGFDAQFPGLPYEPLLNADHLQLPPPAPQNQAPAPFRAAPQAWMYPNFPDVAAEAGQAGDAGDQNGRQRSGSAEDNHVRDPSSKRRAQNRSAQRAFRERRDRHVRDLEAKLASLEAAQKHAASENERLRLSLQEMSTENEILRATSSTTASGTLDAGATSTATASLEYTPRDFFASVLSNHPDQPPSHRIVTSERGQRLYSAPATWELIINHELFILGLVDVEEVTNRLRHQAQCDGQGPVFEESAILDAIEQSVASGSDELL